MKFLKMATKILGVIVPSLKNQFLKERHKSYVFTKAKVKDKRFFILTSCLKLCYRCILNVSPIANWLIHF